MRSLYSGVLSKIKMREGTRQYMYHHLLQFSSSLNQLAIKLEEGRLQTFEPLSLVAHDLTLEKASTLQQYAGPK